MHMLGLVMIMGSMLLLPLAFVVNLLPIVRNARAGNSITANPVNLMLAAGLAAEIIFLWGGLIIDQIPCFMGVPNCD